MYYDLDSGCYLSGNRKGDFKIHGITIEVKTLQGYLTFKKSGSQSFNSQMDTILLKIVDGLLKNNKLIIGGYNV